jgi:hypothetical protein
MSNQNAYFLLNVRKYPWKRVHEWLSKRENLFFVILIVVHLLPIWYFKYFPSADGPVHLDSANVLRQYYFPDRSLFRDYYVLNKDLVPNWFSPLIMAGLMSIVPPLVAEKILLSGYVILLPISVSYALQVIRPDAGFLAILAFPFIYNHMLHTGFYNFSYSLPVFFFVVGYWLKYQNRFTLRQIGTLSLLSLLLYFCHLVSLVMAYVAIALLTIWLTVLDFARQSQQQQFNLRSLVRAFCIRALVPICAFLPTIILVVMFLSRKAAASSESLWEPMPVWKQLIDLLSLKSLVSYERWEYLFSIALVGLFVAVCLYLLRSKEVHHQKLNFWDGFFLIAAAYVVIYFIAPDRMAGGGNIKDRLLLYPFFALTLWFGAQSYHRLVKQRIQLVAMGLALMLLGLHTIKYAQLNNYLEEYVSGMHLIEPNTTLLPLSFSNRGHAPDGSPLSMRTGAFTYASGYIAAEKGVVHLANYQANLDYFPISFRPKLNPFVHLKSGQGWILATQPPRVDFLSYPQRTGGRIDYVLVWGVLEQQRDDVDTKSIFRQLEEGYELLYTSPQRGFMQLYRRKDWAT